jgi:hypothetical protein
MIREEALTDFSSNSSIVPFKKIFVLFNFIFFDEEKSFFDSFQFETFYNNLYCKVFNLLPLMESVKSGKK